MDNNEQKWQSFLQSKPIEIQQLAKGLRTLGFDYYSDDGENLYFTKIVETTDRVRNTINWWSINKTLVTVFIDSITGVELDVSIFNYANGRESILSIQGVGNLVTIEAILETAYKIKLC